MKQKIFSILGFNKKGLGKRGKFRVKIFFYSLLIILLSGQISFADNSYKVEDAAVEKEWSSCYHADFDGFLNHMSNEKCPWNTEQIGTDQAQCEHSNCVYEQKCYPIGSEVDMYINDYAFGRAKCVNWGKFFIWEECKNKDFNKEEPGDAYLTVACERTFEDGKYDINESRFKKLKPECLHNASLYQGQEVFAYWQNNTEHPIEHAFDNNPETYYMA